jgi:hypothetical protein
MASLILILVRRASLYLLDAVLMEVLLYALRDRYSLRLSNMSAPLVLFAAFAFLDLYWMPAAAALDVRLRILNETLAELLGVIGEFSVIELLDIGWFDLLVWVMQVVVALWVAGKLSSQSLCHPTRLDRKFRVAILNDRSPN